MTDRRDYWAANGLIQVGPFETREAAAAALFAVAEVKTATTGYGTYGPSFDVRFIDNPNWLAILEAREAAELAEQADGRSKSDNGATQSTSRGPATTVPIRSATALSEWCRVATL